MVYMKKEDIDADTEFRVTSVLKLYDFNVSKNNIEELAGFRASYGVEEGTRMWFRINNVKGLPYVTDGQVFDALERKERQSSNK